MEFNRPAPKLSQREQELLTNATAGLTDNAIALKLGISLATVGTYWARVRMKVGPYSRTELVAVTLQLKQKAALEALRRENEQLVREFQLKVASGTSSWYYDLLENAPDAMILVSVEGLITYANLAATEMFGYAQDELRGKDLLCLIPNRFRERHTEHRIAYMEEPQRRQMGEHLETPAVHCDGTEFIVRAALSAIDSPTGMIIACAIRAV